jgi:FkbM family methyltransferase
MMIAVIFHILLALLACAVVQSSENGTVLHSKRKHHKPDLELIKIQPPHFPMNDFVLGKSKYLDYNGNHYYYFVFNTNQDKYISTTMQRNGGVWEEFLDWLLKYLVDEEIAKTGKKLHDLVVIDAGANIGAFTLYAGSLGVKVWSFEMQQLVYTLLEMSIRISGYRDRVRIFNVPLWNTTKEITYTTMKGNYGGAYVRRDAAEGEVKATTRRLDSIVTDEHIFFMKIDTENVEEYVLSGFNSVVNAKRVKHIAIGDSGIFHMPIYTWLYSLGYSCRNYGPYDTSNLMIDCDQPSKVAEACYYKDITALEASMKAITRGHLNLVCSLPE